MLGETSMGLVPQLPTPTAGDRLDEVLPGADSALWGFGRACHRAGQHARLERELADWWTEHGQRRSNYRRFGGDEDIDRAMGLAGAACAVLRGLALAHLPEDEHCAQVIERLHEAVSFYDRFWGRGQEPPVPSIWSLDRAEPAAFLVRCLGALDAAWGPDHPGTATVRSALADLLPDRRLLGGRVHEIHTPVLFEVQGSAEVMTLTIEWLAEGTPPDVIPADNSCRSFFADPIALGCVAIDEDFRDALRQAWAFAGPRFPSGARVRWRLAPLTGRPLLGGASVGGAFAAALCGLAGRKEFDAGVGCTATVGPQGRLGPVAWIPQKVRHAQTYEVRRFVVCKDDARTHAFLETLIPGVKIHDAVDVDLAVAHLSGRVSQVLDFLHRLGTRGLAHHVKVRPDDVAEDALADAFCQPARVIEEEQWERLLKKLRENSGAGDDESRYIYPTNEVFLRIKGGDHVRSRDLRKVLDRKHGRVIVRGEPGEGKTTALWLHVARRCRRLAGRIRAGSLGPDGVDCRIPLAVALGAVPPGATSLMDLALAQVLELCYADENRAMIEPVERWLREKVARHEYELCLDALDELASPVGEDRHDWLRLKLIGREVPVLLTTRLTADVAGLLPRARRYRMVCFGPAQVRAYVARYFHDRPELGRDVLDRLRLSPGPRHLAQLPLLLGLLCRHKADEPTDRLPTTRTELLRLGLHGLLERGDRARKPGIRRRQRNLAKERILSHVAWRFHAAEPQPMAGDDLRALLEELRDELARHAPPPDAETLLAEYLQDGVLVPIGADRYSFVLRSFHEYCLAGWIAHESPPVQGDGDWEAFRTLVVGDAAEWGRSADWGELRPLTEPGWRHIWPLVSGQMRARADWVLSVLDAEVDEALGVMAEAVSESVAGTVVERLFRDRSIARLDDSSNKLLFRIKCVRDLAEIGDAAAVPALAWWLGSPDTDPDLRAACALSLGTIGGSAAREALVEWLGDPGTETELRVACVWALGEIGDAAAVAALARWLGDPGEVSLNCTRALGDIGDAAAVAALTRWLDDPDADEVVRANCAGVLGDIGDAAAVAALARWLGDPGTYEEVRFYCAEALGAIGDATGVSALARWLGDPDTDPVTRGACARALGQIGEEEAALVRWLDDPGAEAAVRAGCAEGLGAIGDAAAAAALARWLDDPGTKAWVRAACAGGLGAIGDAAAREALVRWLGDPGAEAKVRAACAKGLGAIGDAAAAAALARWLDDPGTKAWVRTACAGGLGAIGDAAAREALARWLGDPDTDPDLRAACAQSLGAIGDAGAAIELADRVYDTDTDPRVRLECTRVLGRIMGVREESLESWPDDLDFGTNFNI
jgi:HEAT repeat protein